MTTRFFGITGIVDESSMHTLLYLKCRVGLLRKGDRPTATISSIACGNTTMKELRALCPGPGFRDMGTC